MYTCTVLNTRLRALYSLIRIMLLNNKTLIRLCSASQNGSLWVPILPIILVIFVLAMDTLFPTKQLFFFCFFFFFNTSFCYIYILGVFTEKPCSKSLKHATFHIPIFTLSLKTSHDFK